jgi:hypothetical protein
MASGQGTKMAKTNGKPTVEQREHILKHHLGIAIVNDRVHVSYVQQCGQDNCPVPNEIGMFMCKALPCPR